MKPRKLKVKFDKEYDEVTLSLVDEDGNGIILLRGKLGGCAFMSKDEQDIRMEVLQRLSLRTSQHASVGDPPIFENFFPDIRADIERYGHACVNTGIDTGLMVAESAMTLLTCDQMEKDQIRKLLQQEIDRTKAKKYTE